MHILVVIAHPNPDSITHSIALAFADGAATRGHSAELLDLHAEGFDPRWQAEDMAQFEGGASPEDVLREQARIDRADAVAMVFPLYWYGMPALMKGWVDRVWSYGWAYDQTADHNLSLQKPRTGLFLIPAGGNPKNWEPHGLAPAMETIWKEGIMGFLGFQDKQVHFLNGSRGSDARRAGLVTRAFEIGASLDAEA